MTYLYFYCNDYIYSVYIPFDDKKLLLRMSKKRCTFAAAKVMIKS